MVWSLAIAETITWAGIFYLFPAMLMRWEAYFGWSRVELTFGFTGALIISAGTGIFAGRLIDRGHGRTLMTVSAFTGGLLIAMLPLIQHLWQFYLIWLLIGFTMAGCLYEPCFAFLTHVYYPKSKRPIIIVTLVAGFAGTLCFPLSSVITNYIHWQAAVWVFSVGRVVGGECLWCVYNTCSETFSTNYSSDSSHDNCYPITALSDLLVPSCRICLFFAESQYDHQSHFATAGLPGCLCKLCSDRSIIHRCGPGARSACSYHGRTPPIHASNFHVFFYRSVACQC